MSNLVIDSDSSHACCRIEEASDTHASTVRLSEVVCIHRQLIPCKGMPTVVLSIYLLLSLLLWHGYGLCLLHQRVCLYSLIEAIVLRQISRVVTGKVDLSYAHLSVLIL